MKTFKCNFIFGLFEATNVLAQNSCNRIQFTKLALNKTYKTASFLIYMWSRALDDVSICSFGGCKMSILTCSFLLGLFTETNLMATEKLSIFWIIFSFIICSWSFVYLCLLLWLENSNYSHLLVPLHTYVLIQPIEATKLPT